MIKVRLISVKHKYVRFFAAILAITLAREAGATVTTTPPPPDQPQSQIPEKQAPPLENSPNENKFQREDGVIKPPGDVDPNMTEKPPETDGRMPIIPPPGSPGGDPSLKPK